jgi:hypothetical protein
MALLRDWTMIAKYSVVEVVKEINPQTGAPCVEMR